MTTPSATPMTTLSGYSGDAWAQGPERIYNRLAQALVDFSPVSLRGTRVLDVGAGTGAASRAIAGAGGSPVAVDVELDMLRHQRDRLGPAVAGDILHLPFAGDAFDVSVAAFVLAHVAEPQLALREMARVTLHDGAVLAVTFSATNEQPVKQIVDGVLVQHGYRFPDWYVDHKRIGEPAIATAEALRERADAAGLGDVAVEEREVDMGVLTAEAIVGWRLGMAHVAPFVEQLSAEQRARLRDEATAAVARGDLRLGLRTVMLAARTRS
ncbi:MAG TPA: methyltransferase domain-containing protein [Candidatus Dormibacteraeota bacterium]|nr:methyltransferase domain-containing protein [Candidatus Dormibacteraeota bacterium]